MNTMELIRSRRSVRSFDGAAPDREQLDELLRYAAAVETPYALPIEWRILDAKAQKLSCPVITGTDTFIAGKLRRAPHAEEAFGFAFDHLDRRHAGPAGLRARHGTKAGRGDALRQPARPPGGKDVAAREHDAQGRKGRQPPAL